MPNAKTYICWSGVKYSDGRPLPDIEASCPECNGKVPSKLVNIDPPIWLGECPAHGEWASWIPETQAENN